MKSLDGLNSRVDMTEERVRKLEDRSTEFTQSDQETGNRLKTKIEAESQRLGQ